MISANASQQPEVEHQGKTEKGCCKVSLLCSADYIWYANSSAYQGEPPSNQQAACWVTGLPRPKQSLQQGVSQNGWSAPVPWKAWVSSVSRILCMRYSCQSLMSTLSGIEGRIFEGILTWRLSRPPSALQSCWRQHTSRELVDQDPRPQNSTGPGDPTSLVGVRRCGRVYGWCHSGVKICWASNSWLVIACPSPLRSEQHESVHLVAVHCSSAIVSGA